MSRTTKINIYIGLLLATGYFVMLASTLHMGFPRDESFYFAAGELYSQWFDELFKNPSKAFTKQAVDKYFAYNPEHAALPKIMFGLSWRLFAKFPEKTKPYWYNIPKPKPILGLLRESTAMRLPVLILNSTLIFMVFLFGATYISRWAGLIAALFMAFMPRFFWHAHLACFDVPVTVMWFAVAAAFFTSERRSYKWGIITAILWGLALSTKLNAYFIPITLLIYLFFSRIDEFKISGQYKTELSLPSLPTAFFWMLIISPIVYYITWPKLWFNPIGHLKWYFHRHMYHEYYWAYYFGTLYTKPPFPWSFPFVMSLMTIPAPLVLLSLIGLLIIIKDWMLGLYGRITHIFQPLVNSTAPSTPREKGLYSFLIINFLIPFIIIAIPTVPIFGGTKHWFPGLPFLALIAGIAFDHIVAAIKEYLPHPKILAPIAALLLFAVPAHDTIRHYADNSAYYNNFVGGYWAMGDLKMEREFWGNSSYGVLDFLNKHAKKNAKVHFHDTTWNAVQMYYRDGDLRPDIQAVWDDHVADYFLFHVHKEFLDLEARIRHDFGDPPPRTGVFVDGVALLRLYQREGHR